MSQTSHTGKGSEKSIDETLVPMMGIYLSVLSLMENAHSSKQNTCLFSAGLSTWVDRALVDLQSGLVIVFNQSMRSLTGWLHSNSTKGDSSDWSVRSRWIIMAHQIGKCQWPNWQAAIWNQFIDGAKQGSRS